jgi:hypothetical protein
MFCTRCEHEVPDILWENNDHLVLLDHPIIVNMTRYSQTILTKLE